MINFGQFVLTFMRFSPVYAVSARSQQPIHGCLQLLKAPRRDHEALARIIFTTKSLRLARTKSSNDCEDEQDIEEWIC